MTRLIRDTIAACAISTLAFAGYASGSEAPPAPRCLPHADMAALLHERWGEDRITVALQSDGRLLELYAAPSGSWTAALTVPQGISCMVGSGDGFRLVQVPGHDA